MLLTVTQFNCAWVKFLKLITVKVNKATSII